MKRNEELKKHVSIIHCSNNLSLLQRKISNVLLFHAYSSLNLQDEHTISMQELCNYLEYRGHDYNKIKTALKKLISTIIEWNIFCDNLQEEDWTASSILASVNIKNAICTYAYSPRMRQLLCTPMMYGIVNLSIQSNFTSSYGLALYENCSRYRKLGKTKVFLLNQFRKIMGVSDDKYLIFRDFKKRVLDQAIKEVNALSDLSINAHIKKVGHKIISIYFDVLDNRKNNFVSFAGERIKKNNLIENKSLDKKYSQSNENIITKMEKIYDLNKLIIEKIIQRHGADKVENKMKQIENTQAFIDGKISNVGGFLIDSLKKDYVPKKADSVLLEENRLIKEKKLYEIRRKEQQEEHIRKEYSNYVQTQLNNFLDNIEKEKLNEIITKFKDYLNSKGKGTKFVLDRIEASGLSSVFVRSFLVKFLQEVNIEKTPKFISVEQFAKNI